MSHGYVKDAEPAPGRTLAIIGFVLPFLCLWPVGLVLAIGAMVKTREVRTARGLAVGALIVNGFVGLIVVAALAMAPEETVSSTTTVTRENAHDIADALEREVDADIAAAR